MEPRLETGALIERRAGSVRRTSTIDWRWPDPLGSTLLSVGHIRDLHTDHDGEAREVGAAQMHLDLDPRTREIRSIRTTPAREGLQLLVGRTGGWRSTLAQALPDELDSGLPLVQLLDDLSGSNVVASMGIHRIAAREQFEEIFGRIRPQVGICYGHSEGMTATRGAMGETRPTVPLTMAGDALAWHALPQWSEAYMRRARRIDVWRDERAIHLDSWFQDSMPVADGSRLAIHEYRVIAQADPVTTELTKVEALAGALPFRECPAAAGNLDRLLGLPLAQLRRQVTRELRGTAGCTHLNDVMRALSDAPVLLDAVDVRL